MDTRCCMLYSTILLGILLYRAKGADPSLRITRTFPVTRIINGYPTIVANKDSDVLMHCVVNKKPSYRKTQWLFQDERTNTSIPISTAAETQNSYKYKMDMPALNDWRLKIRNVQLSDMGHYICRIQLHGFQHEFNRRVLIVVETPRISDQYTSSDMEVEEGDSVELRCSATGIPPPLISWQLVSGTPLPSGGREFNGPVMTLGNVNPENSGTYKCLAQNRAGTDVRKIKLTVQYRPSVRTRPKVVYQAVGHSKQLKCEVYAYPLPTKDQVLWYREGIPLDTLSPKFRFESFKGIYSVLIKLTIFEVEEEDFGRYTCYAENSKGVGEQVVDLKRSDEPVRSEYYKRSGAPTQHKNTCILLTVLFSLTVIMFY